MNSCPRCATVLLANSTVCSSCGLMLNAAPSTPAAPAAAAPPVAAPQTVLPQTVLPPQAAPQPVVPPQAPPQVVPPQAVPPQAVPPAMPAAVPPSVLPTTNPDITPDKGNREPQDRKRLMVLLAILVIVVIAGVAYYEIHNSSSNNSAPAPPAAGAQSLTAPSTAPTSAPPQAALTQAEQNAQSDLRQLAVAEQSYLTLHNRYTTSSAGLDKAGYRRGHFRGTTSYAGVRGTKDFCLVGSGGGKAPFFLFDSARRGLQPASFPSAASAEGACSDPAIKHFARIT